MLAISKASNGGLNYINLEQMPIPQVLDIQNYLQEILEEEKRQYEKR